MRLTELIGAVRPAVRVALLAAWTFSLLAFRMAMRPVERVLPSTDRLLHRVLMRCWASGALRLLGVQVTTTGTCPPTGHFIVANHLSYLDILVFARESGAVFVAMVEMNSWPIAGFLVRNADTVFIDRNNFRDAVRVNTIIGELLSAGQNIIVFPESTTSIGDNVLPFKPALLEVPAVRGMPVEYASIRYESTAACPSPAETVCWVDDTPFFVHAWNLLKTRRIDARVAYGAHPVTAPARRQLAETLETNVRGLLMASATLPKEGAFNVPLPVPAE